MGGGGRTRLPSQTIALQLDTSYRPSPLTQGPLAAASANAAVAIRTPPSVQVQAGFAPPIHPGLPVGGTGAEVKGASLNFSGNVQGGADVSTVVKG